MEPKLILHSLSSLAKVFPARICGDPFSGASLYRNEEFSFQVAFTAKADTHAKLELSVTVDSPLSECVTLRKVGYVPSLLPVFPDADDNYLQKEPGLFPDPLLPFDPNELEAVTGLFHSLWVTVKPEEKFPAGSYPVRVVFTGEGSLSETAEVTLEIVDASLPEQELIFTQWFHADCIAAYYHTEIFGERHWELLGQFMRTAADNGVNMLLTPLFTPPLDTKIGGERPTTQLVDVTQTASGWTFGFHRLHRWLRLAEDSGIRYFEMSHLFTQWGAAHAPKIIADTPAGQKRIFGWETDSVGPEYTAFLRAFLPELTAFLRAEGVAGRCWFHVSDEPAMEALETYRQCRDLLAEYLSGFRMMDALSDLAFYEKGLVETPVAATNHIEPFLKARVRPLWAYYCCAQGKDVANRFLSMPSARSRVIGAQLYRYDIEGFLHWGYNFYYSQRSKGLINPWQVTDAEEGFPSGDSFSVYPGEDGPIECIGLKVFHEALQDLRALRRLEARIGREAVVALLEQDGPLTFSSYPQSERWLHSLRSLLFSNERKKEDK